MLGGRRITISAGIGDLETGGDADELFRLADGALYWSKAHGRDAAHVYDAATICGAVGAERAEQLARHQTLLGLGALARAIDAKDPTTREHSGRVAGLATALATRPRLARGPRPPARSRPRSCTTSARSASPTRPAQARPLTAEERHEVERHAALGAQIVEGVLSDEQVGWIRGHHERPDGCGYPDGLRADQSPRARASSRWPTPSTS